MSGRKSRKPRIDVPHVPEPIAEENHHFETHEEMQMDVVQEIGAHEDIVMEEAEEDMEMDHGKKKLSKKKKKPAYAFFVVDNRKSVSLNHPELTFGETTQKLATIWRSMSDDQRAPYEEKADQAARAAEYAEMHGAALAPEDGPKKRGRKRKERKWTKDPTAPKKAMTPYIVFGKHVREAVTAYLKEQNAAAKPTEIMREISERWGKLTPEHRQQYEIEAQKDKDRYEMEKKQWMEAQGEQRTTIKKAKLPSAAEVARADVPATRRNFLVRARGESDIYDKVFFTQPVTFKNLVRKIQQKRGDNRNIIEIICLPNHRVRDQDDVDSLVDGQHLEVVFEGADEQQQQQHPM